MVCSAAHSTGNAFSVRDMQNGPRFKHAWKKWNLDVLKSDVWCPLIKSGEVLGILTVGPRDDGSQIPESEYAFIQRTCVDCNHQHRLHSEIRKERTYSEEYSDVVRHQSADR